MNNQLMQSSKIALGVMALSLIFAGSGKADCGVSYRLASPGLTQTSAVGGELRPALQLAAPSPQAASDASIVGLWNVTFVSGGQVVDQGFDQWSSDGTEILNDTPPPATGNVCLGVWTRTGPVYKLKHPSWTFDNAGNLTGTAIIRERITLDGRGQGYSGTFTIDYFDLHGNNVYSASGTVSAQRITVDF